MGSIPLHASMACPCQGFMWGLIADSWSWVQVRGNLRAKREEVFDKVCENLEKEFGEFAGLFIAALVTTLVGALGS